MQIAAYGAQDIYLTGDPQITFFKIIYKRHTHFASEVIEQNFTNSNINFGSKGTCPITRSGDLLTKLYLKVNLFDSSGIGTWVKNVGHAMIDSVELQIGGQKIDKHYGIWLTVWDELTCDINHDEAKNELIGNERSVTITAKTDQSIDLIVPLKFFCCTNFVRAKNGPPRFDQLIINLICNRKVIKLL